MKTRMRPSLECADAFWGPELNELDPALYLRMMIVLGYPEKASLNPILLLDELQDLNVGEIYRHASHESVNDDC